MARHLELRERRCPRCKQWFAVCRACDRWHRYCGRACSGLARTASVRRAQRRYRRHPLVQKDHREKMRDHRARLRQLRATVGDQSFGTTADRAGCVPEVVHVPPQSPPPVACVAGTIDSPAAAEPKDHVDEGPAPTASSKSQLAARCALCRRPGRVSIGARRRRVGRNGPI
jgi:hypothetical protein